MAQKQPDFGATKTEHYRSYTVREHERKMYERVYKFVCIGCDRVVERKSYAVCCPSYGNEAAPFGAVAARRLEGIRPRTGKRVYVVGVNSNGTERTARAWRVSRQDVSS